MQSVRMTRFGFGMAVLGSALVVGGCTVSAKFGLGGPKDPLERQSHVEQRVCVDNAETGRQSCY